MKKRCIKCKVTKGLSDFPKDSRGKDGLYYYCKPCKRSYGREYQKKWRAENKESWNKYYSEYRKEYDKRPEARTKIRVNWRTGEAVRKGILEKKPCEVCGDESVHAHHEDYSKPLSVVWLCPLHHGNLHAKKNDNQIV